MPYDPVEVLENLEKFVEDINKTSFAPPATPSFMGSKGRGFPVGTKKVWGGIEYIKDPKGEWVKVGRVGLSPQQRTARSSKREGSLLSKPKPKAKPLYRPGSKKEEKPLSLVTAKYNQEKDSVEVKASDGKVYHIPMDSLDKLPRELQRKLIQVAVQSSLDALGTIDLNEVFKYLEDSPIYELSTFNKSFSEKTQKTDEEEELPEVDITTPEGARGMALALSRIFGGWRGGCRLSPSANSISRHHITVFCENPEEMGNRILFLKKFLLAKGFKEEAEGIFRNDNRFVYQGRSFSRRFGRRPSAFMLTIEVK